MGGSGTEGLRGVQGERRVIVAAKVRVPRTEALVRERLQELMSGLWRCRLGLVVAPAGSGKTTLLSAFAATCGVPVGWYRAESWDGSLDAFLGHLEAALHPALPGLPRGWTGVEDAARALETVAGSRVVVVIDDFHALNGSPAEAALERLLEYAPASVVFLAASRKQPGLNVSRLRVSGSLLEIGGNDLRFRSWEVERLFRDVYQEPLPPVELAELARRTEGWAAGLQLFHLATSGKPADERRRVLSGLAARSRFVREYLTSNVLGDLPGELRRFLVDSCVLGRLSGPICDQQLERCDSQLLLEELERRQVFTQALDDEGHYRYHEVLRSYLEGVLLSEVGERELRRRHLRAAAVLEAAQRLPEALHAYCRGEDSAAVSRLLGRNGAQLAEGSPTWIDTLPTSVLDQDPWLLLASARRNRANGLLADAIAAYRRAEEGFGASEPAQLARGERQALGGWLNGGSSPGGGALGLLREAIRRDPLAAGVDSPAGEPTYALIAGISALVAGHVVEARRRLMTFLAGADAEGPDSVVARLALGVAGMLAGDAGSTGRIGAAVETAEQLGIGFLARLGRACLALQPGADGAEAAAVRLTCERLGDQWGATLAGLLEGWALVTSRDRDGVSEGARLLDETAGWFESADAPVLEAWARSLLAFARARLGKPVVSEAMHAQRLAAGRRVEGAMLHLYLALAIADPARAGDYAASAAATRALTGLVGPIAIGGEHPPAIAIRLFGRFEVIIHGVSLELSALKPRVRTLLRLLAVQGGRPLHREVIVAALWPEADADSGARNLHVAVSSLRQTLEPGVSRGGATLVIREGDSYRLALGPETSCDLVAFDKDVAAGRRARAVGDREQAIDCFRKALERHDGELLPEDGAAHWVVEHREWCRARAAEASAALAELLLSQGDPRAAAEACAAGLRIDRYQDPLWRLLVSAREEAGDPVAANRARADYRRVLNELAI